MRCVRPSRRIRRINNHPEFRCSDLESREIVIREIEPGDRDWVRSFLKKHFGSTRVVSRNVIDVPLTTVRQWRQT
jgi:hypothetical protein